MAGHRLDAERLGLDRDPNRSSDREESPEISTNSRTVVWVFLIVAVVCMWAYIRARSRPVPSAPPNAALELKVERIEGRLVLTWNKEADLLKDAQNAALTIADGDHTESVPLDIGQLRAGSVVYQPLTGDVSFRLEVVPRGGNRSSASIRALAAPRR
jgi:hypothetical protein